MADARTQAAQHMYERDCAEADEAGMDPKLTTSYCAYLLDAIPNDVLARYAIERGAIEDAGIWLDPNDDWSTHYEDEAQPSNAIALYRLATEDE